MDRVTRRAHAKINLSLDVLGKREDGYHLVRMVMQSIGLSDELSFSVAENNTHSGRVELTCDRPGLDLGESNLIVRAVRVMQRDFSLTDDLQIELKKRIPVAAGMAGGSTDAAAAFLALRQMFVPEVSDEQLQALALPLGADIPYCITGGTQLSEGIGEKLTPLPAAPRCALVIVKPPEGVSTGKVYAAVDALERVEHPDVDAQIAAIRAGDLHGVARTCRNVLEQVTGALLPQIGEIEDFFERHGALVSRMSGSGPTVFAIYEDRQRAAEALEAFGESPCAAGCESFLTEFV